uniref:ribosomal protein S20 n=1 Tax=Hypnea brasiliensis TaxID=1866962 RepID=UPI0023F3ADDA|nr:ribosomal protein S20 [Hypnea brasiliensis]WCH55330.1 ribosomal protein S20 [Hypnea brasiliensis]WDY84871.1 ribosomal protein S20 [Hypnea brasiliensis]
MSKHSSAIKKIQISFRNRAQNRSYKASIKTLTKKYIIGLNSIENLDYDNAMFNLASVYSKIDKAVKKGALPKNTAARKKSILARAMKNTFL